MKSFLVTSPQSKVFAASDERPTPFTRIILPLRLVDEKNLLPRKRDELWWVQWNGLRLILRGYGIVAGIGKENESARSERLTIQIESASSERLTIPGKTPSKNSDVTLLLQNSGDLLVDKIQLMILSEELSQQLRRRKLILGETTWSYDLAKHFYNHLFKVTFLGKQIPQKNNFIGNLQTAYDFVHKHFARSELISVGEVDSYYVAAAVLAGYSELPTAVDDYVTKHGFAPFHRLNHEFSELSARQSMLDDGTLSSIQITGDTNTKHQAILGLLTQELEKHEFSPAYNRFVDLQASHRGQDIFFEVKTISEENFFKQLRLAIGQLLEYRFRFKKFSSGNHAKLVVVIEKPKSLSIIGFAREFLTDIGIEIVFWNNDLSAFEGLNTVWD